MAQCEREEHGVLKACSSSELTGVEKVAHSQVAKGQPHDASFVKVGGDTACQGQGVSKFIEHLGLLTASTASRITQTHLPLLRARPGERVMKNVETMKA